jgi:fibro-slime domain-containing protein
VQNTLGADGKPVYASSGTPFTTHGAAAFNQWYNDVSGVNLSTTKTLTLTKISDSPLLYQYNNPAYFPIDGELFGNYAFGHNYHFTSEIHTQFTYESGQTFSFVGDDDVWVFINNKLVIDLGGVHGPTGATVNLDSAAASIGITPGNKYNLDIFQAERQTSGSTFRITTSIVLVAKPQDTQPPTIAVGDFTA